MPLAVSVPIGEVLIFRHSSSHPHPSIFRLGICTVPVAVLLRFVGSVRSAGRPTFLLISVPSGMAHVVYSNVYLRDCYKISKNKVGHAFNLNSKFGAQIPINNSPKYLQIVIKSTPTGRFHTTNLHLPYHRFNNPLLSHVGILRCHLF